MNIIPWVKLSEDQPPYYKRLLVWADNQAWQASFTSEQEFIYNEESEPDELPTHWIEITKPDSKIERVCF